jgi:hypothetical protein
VTSRTIQPLPALSRDSDGRRSPRDCARNTHLGAVGLRRFRTGLLGLTAGVLPNRVRPAPSRVPLDAVLLS